MRSPDTPRSDPARPCDSEPAPGTGEPPDPAATVLKVSDVGELVAAVPSLIGFHPRDSLVLIATGGETGRRLGLTLRVDLPAPEHVADVGAAAVRGLLLDSPRGAALIVVGGRPAPGDPLPCRGLVDLVVCELEARDVEVHTVVWAESTAAAARWACYDPCGHTGSVPDASAVAFTVAAVVNGQVVHADRAALERLVAPADDESLRRRELLLVRAVDEAVAGPEPGADDPAEGCALIDAAIDDAGGGRLVLDDDRVVALAGALVAPAVRDAAMLACAGPTAAAAEQLWTALVRETPDPEAAEPAALLAVSALLRGDGALANVALDRAEGSWPGHRLTRLLRAVAEAGIRPAELRALLLPEQAAGRDGIRAHRARRPRRVARGRRRSA